MLSIQTLKGIMSQALKHRRADRLNKTNVRASETPEQLLSPLKQLAYVTGRLYWLRHFSAFHSLREHTHTSRQYRACVEENLRKQAMSV